MLTVDGGSEMSSNRASRSGRFARRQFLHWVQRLSFNDFRKRRLAEKTSRGFLSLSAMAPKSLWSFEDVGWVTSSLSVVQGISSLQKAAAQAQVPTAATVVFQISYQTAAALVGGDEVEGERLQKTRSLPARQAF